MKLAIVLHSYSSFDIGKYTGLHFLSVQVCDKLIFYVIQDSALMIARLLFYALYDIGMQYGNGSGVVGTNSNCFKCLILEMSLKTAKRGCFLLDMVHSKTPRACLFHRDKVTGM